jgi:hypothetical protein
MCREDFNDPHTERSVFFERWPEQSFCPVTKITRTDNTLFAKAEWQTRGQHDKSCYIRVSLLQKLHGISETNAGNAQIGFELNKARSVDQYLHSASSSRFFCGLETIMPRITG